MNRILTVEVVINHEIKVFSVGDAFEDSTITEIHTKNGSFIFCLADGSDTLVLTSHPTL